VGAPPLATLPPTKRAAAIERERRCFVAQRLGVAPAEAEDPPEKRPDNKEITATLHEQYLQNCLHEQVPRARERGGRLGGRYSLRPRVTSTRATDGPVSDYARLVYTSVFRDRPGTVTLAQQPASLSYMSYLRSGHQDHVMAIATLRSGHLPDGMYTTVTVKDGVESCHWHDTVRTQEGVCSACGAVMTHHPLDQDCPPRELPWLLIMHRLLDCRAATITTGPNTRPQAWLAFGNSMRAAAQGHEHYEAYVTHMLSALADDKYSLTARERLLSFLICPTHAGNPPSTLQLTLIAITATLLWGDPVAFDTPPAEGAEADDPGGW
jgi:hypothetical protein